MSTETFAQKSSKKYYKALDSPYTERARKFQEIPRNDLKSHDWKVNVHGNVRVKSLEVTLNDSVNFISQSNTSKILADVSPGKRGQIISDWIIYGYQYFYIRRRDMFLSFAQNVVGPRLVKGTKISNILKCYVWNIVHDRGDNRLR